MLDSLHLLTFEIRKTTFLDCSSARGFSLKLVITFSFLLESKVENLVLAENCFPLGLRLDCKCSSEVHLGTMVVPTKSKLLKFLYCIFYLHFLKTCPIKQK